MERNEILSIGAGYPSFTLEAVPQQPKPHQVSSREGEVLRFWAQGLTVKETAIALGILGNTVKTHRSRIIAKMHVQSNAEVFKAAVNQGLLKPEEIKLK